MATAYKQILVLEPRHPIWQPVAESHLQQKKNETGHMNRLRRTVLYIESVMTEILRTFYEVDGVFSVLPSDTWNKNKLDHT